MLMKIIPLMIAVLLLSSGPFAPAGAAAGGAEQTASVPMVELNSADRDALIGVRGIGPALAEAIIKLREKKGAFTSVNELLEVTGIGEKKLSLIRGSITLTSPSSPTALQSSPPR